jgi:Flp pilus assembly protein TadG
MSFQRRRTGIRRRRGAETLELAIILPMFLLITFGIADWCWVFFVRQTMYEAAREGVRAMAVQEMSETDGETVAQAFLTATLPQYTFAVTGVNVQTDAEVSINITIPMQDVDLTGLNSAFMSQTLQANVSMVREGL